LITETPPGTPNGFGVTLENLLGNIDCDVVYTDPSFKEQVRNKGYIHAHCPYHRSKKALILFFLGLIPEWRGIYSNLWFWIFLRKKYSIVYVFLYSIDVLKFAFWVSNKKKSLLFVHIADHNPSFENDEEFRSILKSAHKVACIGRNMREKYHQIFNRNFKVFHNLADDSYLPLNPVKNDNFSLKNPFKLLFIGSLFNDLHRGAIEDVCKAVAELNQQGYPIELHLYGQLTPFNFLSNHINGVSVFHHGLISAEERFRIMDEHHTFIIPASFNFKIREEYCYSIPTKLPELLTSGRPTIIYGPSSMEAHRFCKENDCGILIDEPSVSHLKAIFLKLLKSYEHYLNESLEQSTKIHPLVAKSSQLPVFENFLYN